MPIGFAFPFNGTTYTDMYLSDHTICALNNAGTPAAPAGGGFVYTPSVASLAAGTGPMIAPYWSDHNFAAGGDIFVDNTSGTSCTITWIDVQTYGGGTTFSISLTLHSDGHIDFGYDDRVNNDGSTFGALNAVVGIGDVGVSMVNAVDLSSGAAVSTAVDIFEEFTTTAIGTPNPNFDLGSIVLSIFPTTPGWVCTTGVSGPCAEMATYGTGCGGIGGGAKVIYEEMPIGGFDIASGTTVTYLRTPTSYLVTDSIPGTFVAPTGAAINIAPGLLDGEQQVALSAAMPIPGGSTTALMISTKAYITLNGLSNGPIDYSPTAAELIAWPNPTLAPNWHDYDQTEVGSGLILFEEIGGVAYATWNGVYSFFGVALPDTFQVQFELATGNITIVYQTMQGDGDPFTVGYTSGAPVTINPGAIDWSAGVAAPIEVFDAESVDLALDGNAPRLGNTWDLTTTNIDPLSPISITFLSDIAVNPGLPLTAIGIPAPGCSIYIGNNLGSLTGANVGGSSTVSLPIPNNGALSGASLAAQSICLTLQNPFNILTSNGGLGTIGL
ncbi:MAG: hypothetical protein R3F29_05740 [Planctomycetota bacterium]